MAAPNLPIRFSEAANLVTLGLQQTSLRFGSLTMESDRYICARETGADNQPTLAIIDNYNGFTVARRPIKAESAIMNPVANIIALKAKNPEGNGNVLQVFNLDTKSKVKVHQWNENVVFWRWLSPNSIGMVTDTAVYHWSTEGEEAPKKMFDRAEALADPNAQIIAYSVDEPGRWCVLTCISTPDGGRTVNGHMQLFSVERGQQQILEGHSGCFGSVVVEDNQPAASLFAFAERKAASPQTSRLHIMDVGAKKEAGQPGFRRVVEIPYPAEAPSDFPISMHISEKYGLLFMITKMGYLFIFELSAGALIYRNRISSEAIFITTKTQNGGVIGINRKGQVLSISIDENNLIPFIQNQCRHIPNNMDIAITLARRFGLGGADELFVQQFNRLLSAGDYKGAAKVAADAPGTTLRNSDTINKFKSLPPQPGQPVPILQYFSTLLEKCKLNAIESVELARPILQQGRKEFLEKWVKEDKIECSEQLGDMTKPLDLNLAVGIYIRAAAHQKVITCFMEQGQLDKIVAYAKKVNYQPDYPFLLRNIIAVNPDGALNLAKMLFAQEGGALIDANTVVEIFMQHNRLQETTSFLLEALKANKAEDAYLQTKLLEMNLLAAPAVADAILQMDMFTHYDRPRIGALCEKAMLYQRALEHYTDIRDIKRVLLNTHAIPAEFIVNYFGQLPPEDAMDCLTEMLKNNRNNMQIVVQVAIKYQQYLTCDALIKMFESFNAFEGLFYFLGAIVNLSEDPNVHFKYIEAAAKLGHVKEVERVCRESKIYDPVKVKDFLKEMKLPDPRPLIYVCDQHGFVDELTQYLYRSSLNKYIEVYVVKVNPTQTPVVIGSLLDVDCSEDFIKSLLNQVRGACPVEALVAEVEKRNRLRLIQAWLEARLSEGNTDAALHNALAKIYIDTNKDPEAFLINNQYYDSKVVGKYCEERDPHLAFTAYKRAWGPCDAELVEVTNKNSLFRLQARYLVERQSPELWEMVLNEENEYRRQVIDQVVGTALPETKDPEEVSTTVKAFMTAELPNELIELLEKIVLHNSDFSNNRNLQNLLILTAIKADKTRVMDYINRLDNYDGPDIAKIALGESYKLYEEAFVIYQKFKLNEDAVDVLLNNIESIPRALEFAQKCNEVNVWSKLAKAQLGDNMVSGAIESYIKADDPTTYTEVIAAAEREDCFADLVKYLVMARKKVKDQHIDTELVFSLAKTNKLGELEEFITGPNTANIQSVGDRCYAEQLYEPAKIMFANISNNAKLASCLVHLKQYQAAVDAARKANSPRTWKEVNMACVAAQEFRLAQVAGLHIIIHPDHLEDLIAHYEQYGYFDELIALVEAGLGLERAHVGMFTEMGVLYAKYKPEKLMEHCRLFYQRLNIPKLLRACERYCLWAEEVFLHMHYDEFDNAINCMINHSTACFAHDQFLSAIVKVSNTDLYYRGVQFYLEEQPMLLNELLKMLTPKVDHTRVVSVVRKASHLPLILPYLKSVQSENVLAVNEAINELYVESEEVEALRQSIDEFTNFDAIALAQKIEKHELLEMRRLAAYIYKKNSRFVESIELSKKDKMYKDAMETTSDSANAELAEDLLRFFVEIGDKECFAACLFACYDFIKPDVALELAWRNNLIDYAMPFIIQVMREYSTRLETVEKKQNEQQKKAEAKEAEAAAAPVDYGEYYPPGLGQNIPALMPPPAGYQANMGYDMSGAAAMGGMPGMQMPGYYPGQF